ncbi:G-box-binding factor-like [Anopheles merus]|uniref:Uncharacterized protein n=1 Tax=Anopheles merus TaxID=30066 RepID=A0A182URX5_ANOME|nr:G-box-binding factor-like [Anopheles merus]
MKVFIVLAVSIASMAAGGYATKVATGQQKTLDKRSPWGLFYGGFGDSLARSDDVHGHGVASFAAPQQQYGSGWHQEYQPQGHHWAQADHEPKSLSHTPVHEWQAERVAAPVHYDEHAQQHQFHFGGSFEQPKVEQSYGWQQQQQQQHHTLQDEDTYKDWGLQHQQLQQGGSSHEWNHDEGKEKELTGHGDWAPLSAGSADLLKEHSAQSVTTETKEEHHQEWAPIEGKAEEHKEEHHHTKIIKVPYPVHIEKPYPVYIEKPFIVEKPVPLKLYIKKKHHH